MIPRLFFLSFFGIALAQFQFFEGMFGHQQQQQQQQQQRSGADQYAAQVDAVSCSKYLCPSTLECVDRPVQCPCPHEQDLKCIIPDVDGSQGDEVALCVRGAEGCAQVSRLLSRGSSS